MIRRLISSRRVLADAATTELMNPALTMAIPSSPGGDIAFLTDVLEAHHLPAQLTERLVASAAKSPSRHALADRLGVALAAEIPFAPLDDLLRASALLLFGPPGAGKTTLAAKLAARLGEANTLLINADPDRAGGSAQLEECAATLGTPLAIAADAAALGERAAERGARHTVIDTKGTAPNDAAGCAALAALIAASGATPLLVLPADSAAEEAAATARSFAPLGARMLLPTRLDLVRRLGGVLAAADAGRLALAAAGVTPQFAYGLRLLTPLLLARLLLAGATGAMPQAADAMPV